MRLRVYRGKGVYLQYLSYILEHKWNVGVECVKVGLFWHAITHDLSKFRPSEFFPYAKFFFGENKSCKVKEDFLVAWNYHQKRNKHHWNFWVCVDSENKATSMPIKYIKQMVCDWKGMSRKFGDTALEYFDNNKHKMILHKDVEPRIQEELKNV